MSRMPSLERLGQAAERERDAQLRHFDSLDTKAGIVLGFAGVLVALAGRMLGGLSLGAQVAAALASLLALLSFLPRELPVLELRKMRDRYLRSEASFTDLHLLDTTVEMVEAGARLLARKSMWLRLAASLVALATGLLMGDALLS